MKIVLATGNKGKVRELCKIMQSDDIITMKEAGFDEEIIEDGTTFEENALIKARAVSKKLSALAIANDSGIEVYALDMRPGIYSARYAGEGPTDEERNEKLLSELEDKEDKRARYVCAAAVCFPDGREYVCRGIIEGKITKDARGDGGFGYDPIFIPEGYGCTMAQLSKEEKNAISHRAIAFNKLKEFLK